MIDEYTRLIHNFADSFVKMYGMSLEELHKIVKSIRQNESMTPTKIILPELKIFGLPIEFNKEAKEIRVEFLKQ